MLSGIIATFLYQRGFGFIQSDNKRYFFHVSCIKSGVPILGARVEFELGEPFNLGQPKQAVNIHIIEGSAAAAQALVDASQEGGQGGGK